MKFILRFNLGISLSFIENVINSKKKNDDLDNNYLI